MRKNRTLPATPESHPRRVPLLHGSPSRSESLKPHSVNLRVIPLCLHSGMHFGFPVPLSGIILPDLQNRIKLIQNQPGFKRAPSAPCFALAWFLRPPHSLPFPRLPADLVQPTHLASGMRTTQSSARVLIKQCSYCSSVRSIPAPPGAEQSACFTTRSKHIITCMNDF
jgi:hypothetical protein